MTFSAAYSQKNKAIFLVHSTGTSLYTEGKVSNWIQRTTLTLIASIKPIDAINMNEAWSIENITGKLNIKIYRLSTLNLLTTFASESLKLLPDQMTDQMYFFKKIIR